MSKIVITQKKQSHTLGHLFLTFVTCGAWLPFWVAIVLWNAFSSDQKTVVTTDEDDSFPADNSDLPPSVAGKTDKELYASGYTFRQVWAARNGDSTRKARARHQEKMARRGRTTHTS